MRFTSPNKQAGFTLVEMLVVAPIVILALGAFITVMVTLTGQVLKTQAQNSMVYSAQDALNVIERDVKLSGAFLAGNEIAGPSPQGYTNGTAPVNSFTNVGSNGNMLILRTFATNMNPMEAARTPVYTNMPSGDCSEKTTNKLLTYNAVYFTKTNSDGTKTLWRRVIMQQGRGTPGLCDTPWQLPSCAPGVSGTVCKSNDIRLLDNVSEFNIDYFSSPTASAPNGGATSTINTLAARAAIMDGIETIRVTLSAETTVAGRPVDHTASIRASKLNTESDPPQNIFLEILDHPNSVTVVAGEDVRFEVDTNYNDVNYQWQRSTNGGVNWYNIGGATSNSYSLSDVNIDWDNYRYRVVISDAYDTLTSNSATLAINRWGSIGFRTGWTNYGSTYNGEGYTKTADGLVVLKGLIKHTGSPASGDIIGQLPVGYRPNGTLIFVGANYPYASARVDVYADGTIRFNDGAADWVSLENIRFMPAGGPHNFVNMTPQNGWENYGGSYADAQYVVDGAGRTYTQGLVRYGIMTNGTVMAAPPSSRQTNDYLHIPTRGNAGFDLIGLANNGILAKDKGANGYVSINSLSYPGSFAGWNTLSLQSGWAWYDAGGGQFSTPSYTKAADDLVTLKGLVRSGSTGSGTVIANLPAGYRPKERVLTVNVTNSVVGRVDIMPNGDVLFMTGSNAWFSLDAISFIAEQ